MRAVNRQARLRAHLARNKNRSKEYSTCLGILVRLIVYHVFTCTLLVLTRPCTIVDQRVRGLLQRESVRQRVRTCI